MLKIILLAIILLLGGGMQNIEVQTHLNTTQCFSYASSINVINNDEKLTFSSEQQTFEQVIECLNQITLNSHDMPAFSVSLDFETRQALKSGLWLELEFNSLQRVNDLPFTSLLISVNSTHSGFNLIRKYNGKYEGRCLYLSLEGDMSLLSEKLLSLY